MGKNHVQFYEFFQSEFVCHIGMLNLLDLKCEIFLLITSSIIKILLVSTS